MTHTASDSSPDPSSVPSPGFLEITGLIPQPIWIRIFPTIEQGKPKDLAGFASSETGTYYTEGVKWHAPKHSELAMFLGFALASNIRDVDCKDLHYSTAYPGGPTGNQQNMCVPHSKHHKEYHFTVWKLDASNVRIKIEGIDPKIIVTPINNG
jgi:hypothetical protein